MSHYFELDGMREKIFILQSIALSGESFSKEYAIGKQEENSLYSQKEYWHNTKSIASNGVLELAVKVRNAIERSEAFENQQDIITCIENKDVTRHNLIWICNKIIHAKSFNLVAVSSFKNDAPLEWWDGEVEISGTLQDKRTTWVAEFNVIDWLKSCLFFVRSMEDSLKSTRDQSTDLTRCI